MPFLTRFNCFWKDLCHKQHDFSTDQLAIFLTNTAPNQATHTAYDGTTGTTGPAEIAAGNGYTAGGMNLTLVSSDQVSGTYRLKVADTAILTAGPASMAPFRYGVLYNKANNKLIGYWDRGASITLTVGKQYRCDLDQTNGLLILTNS